MRFFIVGTKELAIIYGCVRVSVGVPLYTAMLGGTAIIDKVEYDVIIVDYRVWLLLKYMYTATRLPLISIQEHYFPTSKLHKQ